jgi:hypothetical protein
MSTFSNSENQPGDRRFPFNILLETFFPEGVWSSCGFKFRSWPFIADDSPDGEETWFDLATGASGVGSIALTSYIFRIDEAEAARRLTLLMSVMGSRKSSGNISFPNFDGGR